MWDLQTQNQQLQNMLMQNIGAQKQAPVHTPKVNGRQGAEAFYLPPDSDGLVLDANAKIVWLIQTDSAGYKTVTPFDISEHKEQSQTDILKSLELRISKLEERAYAAGNKPNNSNARQWKQEQHNDAGCRSNASGRISSAISTEPGKD